jgi:hypothetical protein
VLDVEAGTGEFLPGLRPCVLDDRCRQFGRAFIALRVYLAECVRPLTFS